MATTREAAISALFTILASTGAFVISGRRNRAPSSITPAQSPALFLVESSDEYEVRPTQPPRRSLIVKAYFYNNASGDDSAVPSTPINNALDALDAALKIEPSTGCFTLGGLVYSCAISGEVKRAPGDISGFSLAIVPIKIVFP